MATRSRRILAKTFIGIGGDDRPATQRDDDRQLILFNQPLDLAAKIAGAFPPAVLMGNRGPPRAFSSPRLWR
jgi:hypothetical protein